MAWLGVIGNVSIDSASYPDGTSYRFVGGAALHVAMAAGAYRPAAPIAVVGGDLAWLLHDQRLAALDLASLAVREGSSCAFHLHYDDGGRLARIECDYAAAHLTAHALSQIGRHDRYHVCCRRPLDVSGVLERLARSQFSVDFYVSSAAVMLTAAAPYLPRASTIFVDAAEAELLAGVVPLHDLPAVVISDGPREVRFLRFGSVVARVEPPPVGVVEVTGAGDTLAGAFLAHQAMRWDDHTTLDRAVAVASASVQQIGVAMPAGGS